MDTKRGSIAIFETPADAKKAGYELPLSDSDLATVKPMNRKQRRAWAAKQQRAKGTK